MKTKVIAACLAVVLMLMIMPSISAVEYDTVIVKNETKQSLCPTDYIKTLKEWDSKFIEAIRIIMVL